MCLDDHNNFSMEVRSESIVIHYGDPDSDGEHLEFYIREIKDLKASIEEAEDYIKSSSLIKRQKSS